MHAAKHVILCVADDRQDLDMLREILEANDYLFHGAASPAEALVACRRMKPDLIIVDLRTGEAEAVTRLIGELNGAGCRSPVCLLGTVGEILRLNIDAAGRCLVGVLQKPVVAENLLAMLDRRLKARSLAGPEVPGRPSGDARGSAFT